MGNDQRSLIKHLQGVLNDLRGAVSDARRRSWNLEDEPLGNGAWLPLPDLVPNEIIPARTGLSELLSLLGKVLEEAEYRPTNQDHILSDDEFWTFGSTVRRATIRVATRGFVEPTTLIPLVRSIPDQVVAFLISASGWDDFLDREHHGHIGWHYHYLDAAKRRSNIVLCWDTRAAAAPTQPHPFFHEHHAEGKAIFSARPERWGHDKRKSFHEACAPDLKSWSLPSFRCASAKASAVWPLGAMVIPPATPPRTSAKKGRRAGRG